jgi:hypothetical protein
MNMATEAGIQSMVAPEQRTRETQTKRNARDGVKAGGCSRNAAPRKAAAATPHWRNPCLASNWTQCSSSSKGATSVELKLSVPVSAGSATVKSIGLDPVEAQPRQAFFFDTPDLALNKAGVVVRARRIQGGDGDTVIKLRPVDPSTIDPDLRRSAAFKIEVDVMPGGFVCSASFKGTCTGQEVLNVATGAMPLRKLFSREQRAFYDAHAPAGITMDKLVLLGPTFLLKAKHQPKASSFDRPIVLEVWIYPDGSMVIEVSTKCLPKETFDFGGTFKAYLADRGIMFVADQSAKTKRSLEYYSALLKEEGMAG